MNTDSVRATTLLAVSVEDAFAVFTEEVDLWWKRGSRFRPQIEGNQGEGTLCFEPRPGGRLLEAYASGHAFEFGRVRIWEPPKRLVFAMFGRDFGPGDSTEVEVRFEDEGDQTRVTVEHRGFDAFAPDHPVRHGMEGDAFRDTMAVFWADLLVANAAHVRRRDAPKR